MEKLALWSGGADRGLAERPPFHRARTMSAPVSPHLGVCLWLWLGVILGRGQGQGKDLG